MTLQLISGNSFPSYIALSGDITAENTIPGIALIGKTVYITDTSDWYISTGSYSMAGSGLVLVPFYFPKVTPELT